MFHLSLSGESEVGNFEDVMPDGIPLPSLVLNQWRNILKVNYWSIFHIALELLRGIATMEYKYQALNVMLATAEKLHSFGSSAVP